MESRNSPELGCQKVLRRRAAVFDRALTPIPARAFQDVRLCADDFRILGIIAQDGQIDTRGLAKAAGVDPARAVRRVRRLEDLGYVEGAWRLKGMCAGDVPPAIGDASESNPMVQFLAECGQDTSDYAIALIEVTGLYNEWNKGGRRVSTLYVSRRLRAAGCEFRKARFERGRVLMALIGWRLALPTTD